MLTLTKGFQKPENNDPGSLWFPAMSQNMQLLNDHTHDGLNSQALSPAATVVTTQDILSSGWGSDLGGGSWRQLVTIPSSLTAAPASKNYDSLSIEYRLSTGEKIYPTIEKVSSTTYYIYISDNTLSVRIIYSV